MYFEAVAHNFNSSVKENLDNFIELQEFMNRVEKRCILNVSVSAFNCSGLVSVKNYSFNGFEWELV